MIHGKQEIFLNWEKSERKSTGSESIITGSEEGMGPCEPEQSQRSRVLSHVNHGQRTRVRLPFIEEKGARGGGERTWRHHWVPSSDRDQQGDQGKIT